jgi:cytoplasmic iron level regulating protein YaaA (DUF328/UPF0246 family)
MTKKSVALALLLPPSEGKARGGRGHWDPANGRVASFAALGERREQVARALAAVGGGDEKLLGVGGNHLARAQSANTSLLGGPVLRASERYTGVVWDHLSLASLSPDAHTRAGGSIAVVSGLLGVVGVDDRIPDYRLKMGASLAPMGKLSTWWRPAVSEAINTWAKRRYVIDVLPNEHRAAWVPEGCRGVTVSFVERAGTSTGKVVGHDAKAAKGRFARHLLTFDGHPEDALVGWSDERFALTIVAL